MSGRTIVHEYTLQYAYKYINILSSLYGGKNNTPNNIWGVKHFILNFDQYIWNIENIFYFLNFGSHLPYNNLKPTPAMATDNPHK